MEIITFFDLHNRLNENKCDVYDWFKRHKHFDKWMRAKKYKYYTITCVDEEQRIYQEYKESSDGEAAAPPYFNFWHFILDVYRMKEPTDSVIVVDANLIPEPKIYTDEERAVYIERLLNNTAKFVTVSDSKLFIQMVTKNVDAMINTEEAKHTGCKAVVEKILKIYGGPIAIKLNIDDQN